jgi:A/G-specific adenine glycosylase
MLQQTQVATVLPYYRRFMTRFPDVAALASAPLDEVLHAWAGLGYYARARNLHCAARIVVQQHEGRVPDDIKVLRRLPGIGRSTAGAILALSWSQRHPILDGNARRVLTRYFSVDGDPGTGETMTRLWTLAEACTPHDEVAAYTQAIMDLGAGVCTRLRPDCDVCPLLDGCVAHRDGRQNELPAPRIRRVRPQRCYCTLVLLSSDEDAVLLEQRPARGFWGGLWSFPMFDNEAEALQWLAANLDGRQSGPEQRPSQHHIFTHFDLVLDLLAVRIDIRHLSPALVRHFVLYETEKPPLLGVSKAVRDFVGSQVM